MMACEPAIGTLTFFRQGDEGKLRRVALDTVRDSLVRGQLLPNFKATDLFGASSDYNFTKIASLADIFDLASAAILHVVRA